MSTWKTKIKNIDNIFYNCTSLYTLPDISEWDVSELIITDFIFYNCYSLLEIPKLSKWIEINNNILKSIPFIGFSYSDLLLAWVNQNYDSNIKYKTRIQYVDRIKDPHCLIL